ncbi:type I restriction and modification enzyme subunit R-like protein [Roseivirga pacifica]|uniref:Type I restriction enzyme R protein N terminus (HSDR_N) n=1 Tax=Roseivirga pacifica TaxID=1267423 RepID=A0A1I0QPS4_9BACT|nr:type I restriction enzyme HsdR N-terminal domain-containing protein [Roseivirga pacifica]RKQ42759.1 type I restriction and modification enzyme subunit R-like protein [Roseivirga pacifica]SEW28832.1 Type I restriction enzyme R protein N terminus (HSDR_N) [Roseivirga pacifica]
MKPHKLHNPLEGFDFELLNAPEFKEDSVREEIIVPIIKELGYSAQKPNQIIRSRNLLHPYVAIGSKRKEIYIIPDYLFEVDGKPAWILDAKSPKEAITKSKHVEQAYSYAIHPEVRVKFFALCNGKEFALYNIEQIEPLLLFKMETLPLYLGDVKRFLSPSTVFDQSQLVFKKDLGLHLKRLGFDQFESLMFPNVPITQIGQLDPDLFTLAGAVKDNGESYVVSFDFGQDAFNQLITFIPEEAVNKLNVRNNQFRQAISFTNQTFLVNVESIIGDKLEENDKEIFLPLWVKNFLSDEQLAQKINEFR